MKHFPFFINLRLLGSASLLKKGVWRRGIFTVFLMLVLLYPATGRGEELKAASDIWSPFFMVSQKNFTGIGVEILAEVARRTGDRITIVYVPNNRLKRMFDSKEIDMMVLDSPFWVGPESRRNSIFTDEVMAVQEYVYFLKEHHLDVREPADLAGKMVNIMQGYYYPLFEAAFTDGVVGKVEVNSEASLIKKLVLKRTDAIFMDSIAFRYTIGRMGYPPEMFTRSLELSDTALGIRLRVEKGHVLLRFNRAIAAMKEDGTVSRIIDKYTLGQGR